MGFVDNMLQAESTMLVLSNGCSPPERKSGGLLPVENGRIVASAGSPKRRSAFSVREFPPGCGHFCPLIAPTSTGEAVCVGKDVNSLAGNEVGGIPCGNDCSRAPVTALEQTQHVVYGSREIVPSSNQVMRIESVKLGPVVVQPPETLNDAYEVGPVKAEFSKPKAPDVSKDVHKAKHTAPGVRRGFTCPPQRRIPAVRDFPPFCGRNAPCLSKEESMEVLSHLENKTGQAIHVIEEKSRKVTEKNNVKGKGYEVPGRDAQGNILGRILSADGKNYDGQCRALTNEVIGNSNECGTSSHNEMKPRKVVKIPKESTENSYNIKSGIVFKSGNVGGFGENLRKDFVMDDTNPEKHSVSSSFKRQMLEMNFDYLELETKRTIVLGLMAAENCHWRRGKDGYKLNDVVGITAERKDKKNYHILPERPKSSFGIRKKEVENLKRSLKNSSPTRKIYHDVDNMGVWGKEFELGVGESENFQLVRRSHNLGVSLPPSVPSSSGNQADENDTNVTRNKVRETLRLYQVVFRKLLQRKEAACKEQGSSIRRIDLQAAKILKEKGKCVNVGMPIIGSVPGVEVGDEFHYWVELNIIGLHRPSQAGIDYMKKGENIIATSIVASGGYEDDTDYSDTLIYMGSGGNMGGDKEPEDQKLERGNLALKNSIGESNPVRVIRGDKSSESSDSRTRTYIYDGLYQVERYWQELGSHGKLVFKFKLVRLPDQPELTWKMVKKSKKFIRSGLCLDDISGGKEKIPICAVNTIDHEKPSPFQYVTSMMYPKLLRLIPPTGCDCSNGCSDRGKCLCLAKNGGEFPYNHDGAIVEAKPIVYECGPSCNCPPSCFNRVTQRGIKFQLEIFKTESRGWGVRSLNSIPSGSFICEYAGELLEDKDAEQRTGNDEYLFDIGNEYKDTCFEDGLSTLMLKAASSSNEVMEESSFTIDAAQYGNVGRFVNHSCSPNLYAQNVLYDHEDRRIPHIMLFAVENIPPLKELTYHYNYTIDQVFDPDGNIKRKNCYCGSSECTGRMY